MDVQNILYVIIGIMFLAFNAYRNYQKQEEQRRKAREVRPEGAEKEPVQERPRKKTLEEQFEEWLGEENPPPVVSEKPFHEDRAAPLQKEEAYVPVKVSQANPEKPAAEVSAGRKLHASHPHKFEFPEHEEEPASAYAGFDARDAMIKQIILEKKF